MQRFRSKQSLLFSLTSLVLIMLGVPQTCVLAAPNRYPPPPSTRPSTTGKQNLSSPTRTLPTFRKTFDALKSNPVLQDPLWQQAETNLRSGKKQQRLQAIFWLSKRRETFATTLLLAALQHPDIDTQWFALTALRPRKDPRIVSAFRPYLRAKQERLRLNAATGLIARKDWKALQQLPQDPSPLVREALCRSLLQQPKSADTKIQGCLRDRSPLVRLALARQLIAPSRFKALPKPTQTMVKKVIQSKNQYPFGPPPPRYSPAERLETAAKQLARYRREIEQRYQKATCLFARKYCHCLRRARKRIEKHWQRFLDVEETYQFHRKSRDKARQEQLLSGALMAYRKGQAAYFEGSLCSQYQRVFRIRRRYRKLLAKALFAEQAPLFLTSTSLNFIKISTQFLFDTSYNLFRDDFPFALPPYETPVQGPLGVAFWQTALGLSYHVVLNENLRLRFYNQAMLLVTDIEARPPATLDNNFQFDLLYRVLRRRFHMLFFLEEKLHYTPSPPENEGFADHFVGFRLTQHARLGASFRWGNLSQNMWTQRNDWVLHIDYSNRIELPFVGQPEELTFGRRMSHRWEVDVSRQLFFFRVGLRNVAWLHQWLDVSAQIPTVQWNIYLTFAVGDTYDPTAIAQADGGIGFNLSQPLFIPSHSQIPQDSIAPSYSGEALYLRVRGFVAAIPLQWQLRYDYRAGPPQRPLFPHFVEHRVQAWLRVGALRSLTAVYPRDLQFDVGLDLRFLSYLPFQKPTASANDPDPLAIPLRMGSFTFQVAYPFVDGLRGVLGNRLSIIQNGFRRFGDENKSTNLVLRNVLYIQLEYWFGGRHQPERRTP